MKNKDNRIQLRVTLDEKLAIENKSKMLNITITKLLVNAVLQKPIYIKYLPDEKTEKLKMELAKVGRNLWQLMKNKEKFDIPKSILLVKVIENIQQTINNINAYYDSKSDYK